MPDIYNTGAAITPHDTNDLPALTQGVWVGGAGNVAGVLGDGRVLTFTGVLAGTLLPMAFKRINATGTTATNLVALREI